MEDKIRCFFRKRFISADIFAARKSSLSHSILQCVFIGMILSFSLSMEMYRLDASLFGQYFPDLPEDDYLLVFSMLSLAVYPVAIILNVIFTLVIAGISMLLNYSASCRFSIRDFFAFVNYAATLPAIAASIIGCMISVGFVYLVFNFGTILYAWWIYRRGQREHTRRIVKESEEAEGKYLA